MRLEKKKSDVAVLPELCSCVQQLNYSSSLHAVLQDAFTDTSWLLLYPRYVVLAARSLLGSYCYARLLD